MGTINYFPEYKCVWWGTSHSASRATGSFLISQSRMEIRTSRTNEIISEKDVSTLPPDYEAVQPAAFRHIYSWFDITINNEKHYLICNIRNPYARVASVWRQDSFLRKNSTFFPFIEYIKNLANAADYLADRKALNTRKHKRPWVGPGGFFSIAENINYIYSLYNKKPDLYLRAERLSEDVKKIPFLNFNNPYTYTCYQNYITKNSTRASEDDLIRRRIEKNLIVNLPDIDPFRNWKYYYDQTAADLVYEYLEEDFIYFGYSKDSWKEEVSSEPLATDLF